MSESDILHALEDTQFPQKLRGYDPAEVDDLIDRASREIADLRAEVSSIALGAAERVVQSSLDAEVQGNLIDAYIDEVAGANG